MYPRMEKTRTPARRQVRVLTTQVMMASLESNRERDLSNVSIKIYIALGKHNVTSQRDERSNKFQAL